MNVDYCWKCYCSSNKTTNVDGRM